MSQGLFRREVLEAKRGEWLGSIIVAAPLSRWVWALLAGSFAGGLISLLLLGHYTWRETVSGQLVPSAGMINLVAGSAGTVSRVWVHDGQLVHTGEPLIEISNRQDSVSLGDTPAIVGQQLDLQRQRLEQDLDIVGRQSRQQVEALRAKISLLKRQQEQLAGQVDLQQRQVQIAQSLLKRIEPLAAKGYVSVFQIEQQKSTSLQAQARYRELVSQGLALKQSIEDTEAALARLPLNVSTKHNSVERQLADIRQSIAQNELQRAAVLRAPRDGVVAAVVLKEGQAVAAGQSLLSELPAGSRLQAQLLVPSRAIGFITTGYRVVLRYRAFPYQKFGQQYGTVTDISRSALSPSEVATVLGQATQQREPLYRVQVALDSQAVMAYGKAEPVKPGMALDADILMERRSLVEWVFEPLFGLGHRLEGDARHG